MSLIFRMVEKDGCHDQVIEIVGGREVHENLQLLIGPTRTVEPTRFNIKSPATTY